MSVIRPRHVCCSLRSARRTKHIIRTAMIGRIHWSSSYKVQTAGLQDMSLIFTATYFAERQ